MKHTVSQELFTDFKERQQACTNEEIDPRMVKIVKRFNTIPGVVSMFSCSGHSIEEIKQDTSRDNSKRSYIIFAVEEGVEQILDDFTDWVNLLPHDQWKYVRPKLEFMQLIYPRKRLPDGISPTHRRYNAVSIEMYFRPDMADIFIPMTDQAWNQLLDYLLKDITDV